MVGSRHEELRRDRHGAPARAPGVQGHAEDRRHLPGVQPPRRAVQRHDVLRPHQLLRDVAPRRDENLRLGAGDGGRPDGQRLGQEGPRHRDDRGAQRVRDWREQSRQRAAAAHAGGRLRLAQLRQLDHRRAFRHRERPHRPAAGVLPHLVPARQRGAGRRRQVRSGARRWSCIARYFGAHSQAHARAARDLHARAGAGRRALGDGPPRGQRAVHRRALPHPARSASRRHGAGGAGRRS